MKADIEYGIQIINFTSCIDILVIKREKNIRAYGGHSTFKSNYYSFMGRGGDWKFSMNRATKAFHNNLESAVEHIMAGRTSYGEYPQLVSNDVKIDAIEKCSRVFNKLKNMDKYKEIIASKQAKVEELWNKTNVISEERRAIEKEIEEFKKSVGI